MRFSTTNRSAHPPSTPRPTNSTSSSPRIRMASLFNKIRASIYASVLLFTVICLAMAGHFQQVLAASDLTRFVPFAIFVCSASLFIILLLLGFSFFLRERNPISTRIELASLGLAGIFWLVLGVYLTTSEAQVADVECFASPTSAQPLDDSLASFHTDQYQAMYRVLMVFALLNAILVLLSCLGLLYLAIRRHKNGDDHMWHGPVTSCAWFNDYGKRNRSGLKPSLLPTAVAQRSRGSPPHQKHTEKPAPVAHKHSNRSNRRGGGHSEKPYPGGSPRRQDHSRQNSGNSSLIASSNEFDSGGMHNPNRTGQRGFR
ncbi:hypothetical protein BD779DRAFT_1491460 [Infundibulicybe gibba]|nr:hypothetical protein BD779DRAFT_1491460 [Infundibulicybe gibba]